MVELKFKRFTINQRIEHIIFFATFILLAYTGFPLKFPDEWWSRWMIASVGGFDNRTLIHHISGLIMLGVGAYHIIYHILLEKPRFDILFNPNDLKDIKQHIKYLIKDTNEHPKFGRYTWKQKFEYFGAGFGILIMGFTGMLMWNPFESMKYFPIGFIQMANLFHTWEAVLASLAIFIGHLYDEHLGKFPNMSWFTGVISEKEMMHEHPAEYEAATENRQETKDRNYSETHNFNNQNIKIRIGKSIFTVIFLIISIWMLWISYSVLTEAINTYILR